MGIAQDLGKMTNSVDSKSIITHDFPAWRDKSDFIIGVDLSKFGAGDLVSWEQIWARKLREDIFEVCCIPFFAYGIALGDHVRTQKEGENDFMIKEVVKKNGHIPYRVWFESAEDWGSVIDDVRSFGCFVESRWEKSRLIAIDAPDEDVRIRLEAYLKGLESAGAIKCEIAV